MGALTITVTGLLIIALVVWVLYKAGLLKSDHDDDWPTGIGA